MYILIVRTFCSASAILDYWLVRVYRYDMLSDLGIILYVNNKQKKFDGKRIYYTNTVTEIFN